MKNPVPINRATKGFTLVEILVSVALLSLLILFLGRILTEATRAWDLGEASAQRLQNVHTIGDSIREELQAALRPVDRSSSSNLQFLVNPANASGAPLITPTLYGNPDAIFWQAPIATTRTYGDIAEVGYFVYWDTRTYTPKLCRFFVNPGENAYRIISNPNAWLSDSLLEEVVPAVNPSSTTADGSAYVGVFAENILGLWVTCLNGDSEPILTDANGAPFTAQNFPSTRGYDSRRGYTDSLFPSSTEPRRLPEIVEISFVAIDPVATKRITPEILNAIREHYQEKDAAAFVKAAQADTRLTAIRAHLRPYQTKVILQNSR